MSEINIVGVSKEFPHGSRALDNVNLQIADGQFAVLVRPSGLYFFDPTRSRRSARLECAGVRSSVTLTAGVAEARSSHGGRS